MEPRSVGTGRLTNRGGGDKRLSRLICASRHAAGGVARADAIIICGLNNFRSTLLSDPACPVAPERVALAWRMAAPEGAAPVEWRIWDGLTDYETAVSAMEARADAIAAGEAPECVWLMEHPALYTAGTSAKDGDLVDRRFRFTAPGAAGNSPTMGRANGSAMSCWTSSGAAPT